MNTGDTKPQPGAGMSDAMYNEKLTVLKKIFSIYNNDPESDDPDSQTISSTETIKAMRAAGLLLTEAIASDIECDIDCDFESLCTEELFLALVKKHYIEPPEPIVLLKAMSAINNGKVKMKTDDLIHALEVMGPRKDRFSEEESEHFRKVVDKKGTGAVNLKGLAKYMTTSIIPKTNIKAT